MQIKTIWLNSMDLDCACGRLVAKNISNHGELGLVESKITKPGYEAFNVELGDKHVIKL